MKIYTISGIGRQHPLHTEDHIFYRQIDSRWFVGAVMDGCSSAKESYFPSTLYAKSLSAGILRTALTRPVSGRELGEALLNNLMNDLRTVQEVLALDLDEILATIILVIVDKQTREVHVWSAGDGYIICNGEVTEIDHRNTPDYPAYHLRIPFQDWLQKHVSYHWYPEFSDLAISTDGVGKIVKNPMSPGLDISVIDYLLLEKPDAETDKALQFKYDRLLRGGYIAYDDVAVLRVLIPGKSPE